MITNYPPRARRALERLLHALAPLAPEPSALVVFGSLAKGEYRDGESDINLAVVLRDASPAILCALAEPLRAAHREARVEPFVIEAREVAGLADVFPIKLADIRDARHVIAGDDPFGSVVVQREHLRLRAEQELRNQLVRLRRQAVFGAGDVQRQSRAIYLSATSLAIELGALLRAAQHEVAPSASMQEVMRRAAAAFDLDGALLAQLCAIKAGAAIEDPTALFERLLATVARAVAVADSLEVGE